MLLYTALSTNSAKNMQAVDWDKNLCFYKQKRLGARYVPTTHCVAEALPHPAFYHDTDSSQFSQ